MDWKQVAVEKLRQYEAKKHALQAIPDEIARLESAAQSIHSATSDGTPVQGGGSTREDRLLSNIVHRQELEQALQQAQHWVHQVDGALDLLSREEQLILDGFYIRPARGNVERLAGEIGIDVKTVYRRKDLALRRFTTALYGGVET